MDEKQLIVTTACYREAEEDEENDGDEGAKVAQRARGAKNVGEKWRKVHSRLNKFPPFRGLESRV